MELTQGIARPTHDKTVKRSNRFTLPTHSVKGVPFYRPVGRKELAQWELGSRAANYSLSVTLREWKVKHMQLTETTFGEGRGPGNATDVTFPTLDTLISDGEIIDDETGDTLVTLEEWENALRSHKYVRAVYGPDWTTSKGAKGFNIAKKALKSRLVNHFGIGTTETGLKVSFRDAEKDQGHIMYTLSRDESPKVQVAPTAVDTVTDSDDSNDGDATV